MRRDIVLRSNSDWVLGVRQKAEDGTPYLVSAAALQVRETPESTEPLLSIDHTDHISLDGVNGWVLVRIPAALVAAIESPPANAEYDLIVTRTADGYVLPWLEGTVRFEEGITR